MIPGDTAAPPTSGGSGGSSPAAGTVLALRRAFSAGELSARDAVESALDRIAAREPWLQCLASVAPDEARHAARVLDRGATAGVLHGVPLAIKDCFDVAGQATRGGSALYAGRLARADAPAIARLKAAGAIILARARMQELAFGGWGTHAVEGTPRNPWDTAVVRVPGGSSSGSAVAVAGGLVPAALGTDTGGSVRIPAALCGLVGLKTTLGQVPREGVLLLSKSLDSVGVLARSVGDAVLLYRVLQGAARSQAVSPRRWRIGLPPAASLGEVAPAVLAAWEAAAVALSRAGADLVPFDFLTGEALAASGARVGTLIAFEGWQRHGAAIEALNTATGAAMDPAVRGRFLAGRDITPAAYADALGQQLTARERALAALAGLDAVLTPTVPLPALPLSSVDEAVLPYNRYTRVVNDLGLCALAVPAGLDGGGLPLSVQLIGAPDAEDTLLSLGAVLEAAFGILPLPPVPEVGPGSRP